MKGEFGVSEEGSGVNKRRQVFARRNYGFMLLGVALIGLGFWVMSWETAPYGFGVWGLTVGPMIVLSGFVAQFWSIFS